MFRLAGYPSDGLKLDSEGRLRGESTLSLDLSAVGGIISSRGCVSLPASQAASQLSRIMLQGAGILGIMRLVCWPLAPSCGAFGKPLRSSDGKCGLR